MKFSVIIPVYNVAPYLRECLDSVLRQTFTDWEAICVDDGSTDGSDAILDEYAERFNKPIGVSAEGLGVSGGNIKFKVIHQKNQGVSAARNRGLEESSGDWIGFVDADDVVDENWLAVAAQKTEDNDSADMITFGQDFFDATGIKKVAKATDPYLCGFFQSLYRRETLGKVRFPPYIIGEDRVYTFKCLAIIRKNLLCEEIMYHYRLREGSAIRSRQTLIKRWHNFRHSIDIAFLMPHIKGMPLRWRARVLRGVWTNFWQLLFGDK